MYKYHFSKCNPYYPLWISADYLSRIFIFFGSKGYPILFKGIARVVRIQGEILGMGGWFERITEEEIQRKGYVHFHSLPTWKKT